MTDMTRRTLLRSAAAVGVGALAGCTTAQEPGSTSNGSGRTTGNGGRFGVGDYNTQEVADELRYIEGNVRPLPGQKAKRVLITGSTGGLGQLTASFLLARGHSVVAHARNDQRASDVRRDLPGLEAVVTGDLSDLDEAKRLAARINKLGAFDVIVYNAGEYGVTNAEILNVNSLSPYLLTSLVDAPEQSIYLTSDLHRGGDLKLDELRTGGSHVTYDDSKLQILTLAMAVARRRPELRVNAVAPGWVPTLMGFANGPYAPDDLRAGYMTQVWLAEGREPASRGSGGFLFHRKPEDDVHRAVLDTRAQDDLLDAYAERTGVVLR
ncbi:SDR family NAD(P)-dependent oxidoreductase [Streptomyces scopuliridis]|uniref:SDR family NAD(P)-dependent oxidoreductase n=1 Tax=Streptomyces scopuliridis TaxID=452529 RepID=UPI002DD90ADB|nr:SDR family NAD(P)-dependent oxidoreductase [Streptomyces scopuliridis]WSB33654.1 SDR family NAD(P)-dependent oxidoreductase [Streptomyces scopuliridis]